MEPIEALKKYFGYDSFRSVQEDVIHAIGQGRDVVAIMPTGAGKSVCFQIPAMLLPAGTLVISPLISLMKDQVEALVDQGIPASYVNSTVPYAESIQRLRDLYTRRIKLLYMAPEKLEPSYFTQCLQQVPLSMVVVDEAHCVSQWGHDFRPSYQKIKTFIDSLPYHPIVTAFTATATPVVERDMKESLGLGQAQVFRTGLDRPNLSFRVISGADRDDFILRYVKAHKTESGIIYCATRKAVDEMHERLTQAGIKAGRYHAGMLDEERQTAQDDFSYDRIMVMAATNAFGMGIDKSNVRYVLHYQMPKSLESYYQEAGRAGRDGEKAECILLYSAQDRRIQNFLIEQGNQTEEQRRMDYHRLNMMENYCRTTSCLRNYILDYFGEKAAEPCGHCSSCENGQAKVKITDVATLMFRTVDSLHSRYGAATIAAVLKGSRRKEVVERNLDTLPTFGKLSFTSERHIKGALTSLVADGYLMREGEPYPVLTLTDKAKEVLAGKRDVYGLAFGAEDAAADAAVEKGVSRGYERGGLFDRLRRLRSRIAEEEHVPPFVIFSDTTLSAMVKARPTTMVAMETVHGVGAFKLQKYGARFLAVISGGADSVGEEKEEDIDQLLLQTLKVKRNILASRERISKSSIATDKQLEIMALRRPKNKQELQKIKGIGPAKAERYGDAFLDVIWNKD